MTESGVYVNVNVSDCIDDRMRVKAIKKACRAVALSGHEPQVKAAARKVELLIGKKSRTRSS